MEQHFFQNAVIKGVAGLACVGLTAGREFHPAPKVMYSIVRLDYIHQATAGKRAAVKSG
jgi:hypothetical protein